MSFLRTSSEDRIGVSGLEEAANKLKANLIATYVVLKQVIYIHLY